MRYEGEKNYLEFYNKRYKQLKKVDEMIYVGFFGKSSLHR